MLGWLRMAPVMNSGCTSVVGSDLPATIEDSTGQSEWFIVKVAMGSFRLRAAIDVENLTVSFIYKFSVFLG